MKKFIAWSLLCMLGGVPAGAQETDAKAPAAKETKSDVKEASIVFDRRPDREMYVYVYQ